MSDMGAPQWSGIWAWPRRSRRNTCPCIILAYFQISATWLLSTEWAKTNVRQYLLPCICLLHSCSTSLSSTADSVLSSRSTFVTAIRSSSIQFPSSHVKSHHPAFFRVLKAIPIHFTMARGGSGGKLGWIYFTCCLFFLFTYPWVIPFLSSPGGHLFPHPAHMGSTFSSHLKTLYLTRRLFCII